MVIDPSLSNQLLSIAEWSELAVGVSTDERFTLKFRDRGSYTLGTSRRYFTFSDLWHSRKTRREYLRVLRRRDSN